VATKADQVKNSKAQTRRRELANAIGLQPQQVAWVSAQDDIGLRELRAEVGTLLTA
jgi:GTP-binding protein EngB required for normal cell division